MTNQPMWNVKCLVAIRFQVTCATLSGALVSQREDPQLKPIPQIHWIRQKSIPAPTELYHMRVPYACNVFCPICTQTDGLDIGELWVREYGIKSAGLIITMPTSVVPPLSVEDVQIAASINLRKVQLEQHAAEAIGEVADTVDPGLSANDILALRQGLHEAAQQPSKREAPSREDKAQRRRLAATQAATYKEQHIKAVQSHQLLLCGPLLKRLFTEPTLLKAKPIWEGGDPAFMDALIEQDAGLRTALSQSEGIGQAGKSSITYNRNGRPPLKEANPDAFLERLSFAAEALRIKERNSAATWHEIAHAIKWPFEDDKGELKKLKRACDALNGADEETLSALKEYQEKKT